MADDDDKPPTDPTPANPPTPPVPPAPPHPEPSANDDGLREMVANLAETVNTLAVQVSSLVAGEERDIAPTSRPWTHWGTK